MVRSRRCRGSGLLLLVLGVAGLAPRVALALSVDRAVVVFNPKKGDGFVAKGRLDGLSLEGDTVSVTFGSFVAAVPRTSLVAKGPRLVFKAPSARGLRTLVLDGAKQRFLAVAKGLSLGTFHNPAAIRLSAGDSSGCAMIRLAETPRRWQLAGVAGGGACALEARPSVAPSGLLVQTATTVQVAAVTTGPLDGGSAALVRVDANLAPVGSPLCTLSDDGASGDDVADDGVYGCVVVFDEASPGRIPLLVQASVGGGAVVSPSVALDVVTPLTADEANAGIAGQEMAVTAWDESLAAFGDGRRARRATVARIRRLPGVGDAQIAADGYSIWIRYQSGVEGSLNLDPPGTPGAGPSAASLPSDAIARLVAPRAALPTVPPRVGNTRVLVWDPWADETNADLPLLATLRASTCPALEVTHLRNEECTIDSVRTFPSYGTVVILTHGAVLQDGSVALLSREKITELGEWFTYADDLKLGRLLVNNSPRSPDKRGFLVVKPGFIANLPGRFPDGLVYAGACLSAANRGLADVLFAKGVKAYFGMTRTTYATFSRITGNDVFGSLLAAQRNAFDALAHVVHRTDRQLIEATGVPLRPLDTEVVLFGGDGRLAYPCGASGEELLDTVTVAVNGETTGTAALRSDVTYRLVVTGTATESLSSGSNEFDAFYCFGGFCSAGPFSDPRLVGVAIVANPGDAAAYVGLSDAIEGPYPPFQAGHRYEVTFRPPANGRLALRSPHVPSEGPFGTSGAFTVEIHGPR